MNTFQAYLLAAGNGNRAGGPKAWQQFGGSTLLEKQISFLLQIFKPQAITISIQNTWTEQCKKIHPDIHWTPVNSVSSPLGALQALLKACPMQKWSFVYHVDMPVWEHALFKTLENNIPIAEEAGKDVILPVFENKKGHPVLLSSKMQENILALNPTEDRLDFWLRTRASLSVEVPFSCIHENWNVPVL